MKNTYNLDYIDKELAEEKYYWTNAFKNVSELNSLPADGIGNRPESSVISYSDMLVELPSSMCESILRYCNNKQTVAYSIFLMAVKICLYKYTSTSISTIKGLVHKQFLDETLYNEEVYFIDEVLMEDALEKYHSKLKDIISTAYRNQKYPMKQITSNLISQGPASYGTLVTLDSINTIIPQRTSGIGIWLDFKFDASKKYSLTFHYDKQLYREQSIKAFSGHIIRILDLFLVKPKTIIRDIFLDTKITERASEKTSFNEMPLFLEMFDQQVKKIPLGEALDVDGKIVTYSELDCLAKNYTCRLANEDVVSGDRIGVMLDHSVELIASIIAIFRLGAIFIPIDPLSPITRAGYICEKADIHLLITNKRYAHSLKGNFKALLFEINDIHTIELSYDNLYNQDGLKPCQTAYIMFTSGSTGNPKGVVISHRALSNYLNNAKSLYVNSGQCSFALYSSLAFDLTVTSIFLPLATGKKIIIYPRENDVFPIDKIINDCKTDILKLTPSHLKLMKEFPLEKSKIKMLIVGGEVLPVNLADSIYLKSNKQIVIINEYGPTEATVGCMFEIYDPAKKYQTNVALGKPMNQCAITLLDCSLQPVPQNGIGEIYISGPCIADGYLCDQYSTVNLFLNNNSELSTRSYKTGDLAKRSSDGELYFIGRRDDQLKLNGIRIEKQEIVNTILSLDEIRNCYVRYFGDDRSDKNHRECLVIYYVSKFEIEPSILQKRLAEWVFIELSSILFVHIKKIPLTANGKVDVSGLPDLDQISISYKSHPENPENEVEIGLIAIWKDVIGIKDVFSNSNFFDLGGNSLMVNQVLVKVSKTFGVSLGMRHLFENPILKEFAKIISNQISNEATENKADELDSLLKELSETADSDY